MYCQKCEKLYPKEKQKCDVCDSLLVDELNVYGEALKNSDESAFPKIYEASKGWVVAEVSRMLKTDVEDCVQEIYIRLYRGIKSFDPEKGTFRQWFNAVVRNTALKYIRDYKPNLKNSELIWDGQEEGEETSSAERKIYKKSMDEIAYERSPESVSPEFIADKNETQNILIRILEEIPEGQRACITLYYLQDKKQREIADELGISENTVSSRLRLGKKAVKDRVFDLERRERIRLHSQFVDVHRCKLEDIREEK